MNTAVWKEFDLNPISHSAAHHLMAIDGLIRSHGYARVSDVAKALSITRGSASITLKALKEKGLVEEDENKFLHLSEVGTTLAQKIESSRIILIKFMKDVLHVSAEQAEIDACKMEHLISGETGEHMLTFLKFLFSGDERSRAYLNAFQNYKNACCDDIAQCPVCETECLLGS
ncbi:MAG: metal-dependent transcriptional regulator [bacterium]